MPYYEKNFQSEMSKKLKELRTTLPFLFAKSMALEYKCKSYSKRLNLNHDFEPQQLPKLYQSKHKCTYKKLSDLDISLKPYDAFQLCDVASYIVAGWKHHRKKAIAYFIDIDNLLEYKKKNKSLTEEEAKKLAHYIIKL